MSPFTVFDLLADNASVNNDKAALILKDEVWTYGELLEEVEKVAAFLHSAGIRRGHRVGIHLPKSIQEIAATFAIARLGAVFVNINYQWSDTQLRHVLGDCDIRILFTDGRRAKRLFSTGVLDEIGLTIVKGTPPDHSGVIAWDSLEAHAAPPPCPSSIVDLAALLYTSGSTGKPKGVMLSHQNIILGAQSVSRYLGNTGDDRVLSLPPLSFDYGLNQITTTFLVGGTVVLQPVAIPAEIAKTVEQNKVTGLALVSPSWVQLVRYLVQVPTRFSSLRYLTNTGGKIPQSVLEQMPALFPGAEIFLMYGLTEAFRSTYLAPDLFGQKMGAIGRAIPGEEIYVVDPEKGVCGPGEPGELIHRGGLISQGYWNNPDATKEKIRSNPHLQSIIGDEKVLHSGDIVCADQDGDLWYVGRVDSMIKSSGHRISPTEVEEIVCQHPEVKEAVAFGVDDDEIGQVIHIAVSTEAWRELKEAELRKLCVERMPTYMVPRKCYIQDEEFPRTPTGKTDRQSVINQCLSLKELTC